MFSSLLALTHCNTTKSFPSLCQQFQDQSHTGVMFLALEGSHLSILWGCSSCETVHILPEP